MSLYELISGKTVTVDASGGSTIGTCEIQTPQCTAKSASGDAILIVHQEPKGEQINTCSTCMEWMIKSNRWRSKHTPQA